MAALDRRKLALATAGVDASAGLAMRIVVDAGRAARQGLRHDEIKERIRPSTEAVRDAIREASLAADLDARLRIRRMADRVSKAKAPRGFAFSASSVYRSAVEFTQSRLALSPAQVDAIRDVYGANAVDLADDLATMTAREAASSVESAIRRGLPPRAAVREVNKRLVNAGLSPEKPYRLQTMFRTQTASAYEAGRWQALQSDVAGLLVWGYEYVTVGDDRVRPNHAAMDGIRLPADDPFWLSNWPPNGWNCRCSTIEIIKGDPEAEAVHPPSGPVDQGGVVVRAEADDGWQFNPGKVAQQTAILSGF